MMNADDNYRWVKVLARQASLLIVLFFVPTLEAQKTTRVEIQLQPCDAKAPTRVSFVLNGKAKKELDHTLDHWFITLPETDEFVIQDACASLRLGGARTNCQRPVPAADPDHRYVPLAQFTFVCDEQDAWPVVIRTLPSITVSYLRKIEATSTPRDPRACPCIEADSFADGKRTLPDVRFPAERLLLQLGVAPPNDKGLGLDINTMNPRKTPNNEEYSFSASGVEGLLSLQRARGNSSAPTLSSTAIDIDAAHLKKMSLKQLTVTVN